MTFKPYPVLTLLTAVSVVILIMFGNWQWSRYEEKMALAGAEPEWATVSGTLLPGTVRQVYSLAGGSAAWRDVVLVETEEGAAFVAQTLHYGMDAPAPTLISEPQFFSARGIWHEAGQRNTFSTKDDPEAGLFYAFDPVTLAASCRRISPGRSCRACSSRRRCCARTAPRRNRWSIPSPSPNRTSACRRSAILATP
jgi:surfeit locus 1 family protein